MSRRRLVLVGGGHAHVRVLRDWVRAPVPGVELVVISPQPLAPYSGMVPGWLAGLYDWPQACIDVRALARAAGARWMPGRVQALDADDHRLTLNEGGTLQADVLSLNIGSTLRPPAWPGAQVLALRPLDALHDAVTAWRGARQTESARDWHVAVAGGGAAGVESLLALRHWALTHAPQHHWQWSVVTRSAGLLPGMAAGASRRLLQWLQRAGVRVHTGVDLSAGSRAEGHSGGHPLDLTASRMSPTGVGSVDLWLWATGGQAHDWPSRSGLTVDVQGFVRVDAQLRSVSHPAVLGAGDGVAFEPPVPRSGVTAVRMGPVLSANLRAALGVPGAPWKRYRPQSRQLALISTGDRHAVAAWGPWAWQGRWVWRWKDRIDRAFIAAHSVA